MKRRKQTTASEAASVITAAGIDVYEAAVRTVTEVEWFLSREMADEPISCLVGACADVTRDVTAIQLSTARWLLDL